MVLAELTLHYRKLALNDAIKTNDCDLFSAFCIFSSHKKILSISDPAEMYY
jgi:hypothetical protein